MIAAYLFTSVLVDYFPRREFVGISFDRSTHAGPSSEDATPRRHVALDDLQAEVLRDLCLGRARAGDVLDELGELGLAAYVSSRWAATREGYALLGIKARPTFRMPARGHHDVIRLRRTPR